ncbi:cyclic-di-AMP-binding protein CbpB [Bacillus sp. FJAT-45037]|uniref:cyclic-di-AMP-binding protein CbpB n=1 Tax=Bacillus sp. FJAT-45037 TaxID=2011007 RepID=UPI000C2302B7|nr:cyclic-di-AMP-binding protein CbpB [Bacillus sp. FJAT-45037]
MIQHLKHKPLSDPEIFDMLIPSEQVAHVQLANPLEHALLVLIKSGYTAIPVLDPSFKLHGLISKSLILDSLLGLEQIEMDRLSEKNVKEVMDPDIPTIYIHETFAKALTYVINHPFICVLDEQDSFTALLTRRSILALVSKYLHQVGADDSSF